MTTTKPGATATKPGFTRPGQITTTKPGATATKPGFTKPGQITTTKPGAIATKPGFTRPGQITTTKPGAIATKPGFTKPGQITTTKPGAIATKPGFTKPGAIATKPGFTKPGGVATAKPGMIMRKPPAGTFEKQRDGSLSVRTKAGNQYGLRKDGSVKSFVAKDRTRADFRPDGSIRNVHTKDIAILHKPEGGHRIIRERADHSVIVSEGVGHGYIQRPFEHNRHEFVERAYYHGHERFSRFYEPYHFGGFAMFSYVPAFYYPPVFYDWTYRPWLNPVPYRWGWVGAPWYAYYGPYFAPYPVYRHPAFWLTDFVLASALEADYQSRAAAAEEAVGFAPGQVPLSPEVKDAISQEVRWQLSLLSSQSQVVARTGMPNTGFGGLAQVFSDNRPHIFVAGDSLEVMAGDNECMLTAGDVLQLNAPPPAGASAAFLQVLASKGGDCSVGSVVAVSLEDLQAMMNYMRETLDQGLAELRAKQGQGGLPPAPAAALRGGVQASFQAAAPPVDPNGIALLNQQEQQGIQVEQQVLGEAFEQPQGAPPATIYLGQTMDEVVAILGSPQEVVDLGAKKIYVYRNLKVFFTDGRVTDVQ